MAYGENNEDGKKERRAKEGQDNEERKG
jgi:hypothetical protein